MASDRVHATVRDVLREQLQSRDLRVRGGAMLALDDYLAALLRDKGWKRPTILRLVLDTVPLYAEDLAGGDDVLQLLQDRLELLQPAAAVDRML